MTDSESSLLGIPRIASRRQDFRLFLEPDPQKFCYQTMQRPDDLLVSLYRVQRRLVERTPGKTDTAATARYGKTFIFVHGLRGLALLLFNHSCWLAWQEINAYTDVVCTMPPTQLGDSALRQCSVELLDV